MNQEIVDILLQFAQYYKVEDDIYRARAYQLVADGVRMAPPITKDNIPTIDVGKHIMSKIVKFVQTHQWEGLTEIQNKLNTNTNTTTILNMFEKILGVGPQTAKKWLAMGIRDINDVAKLPLTTLQSAGVKYYDDLQQRIPHVETKALGEMIIANIKKVDYNANCVISGSYRREKPTQGDIDIIVVTSYNANDFKPMLSHTLELLAFGEEKITGVIKSPISNIMRHVDIWFLTKDVFIPFLLYSTGGAEHNKKMRGIAKAQGYKLNQLGLFKNNKKIVLESEKDLYRILGVSYVEPKDR